MLCSAIDRGATPAHFARAWNRLSCPRVPSFCAHLCREFLLRCCAKQMAAAAAAGAGAPPPVPSPPADAVKDKGREHLEALAAVEKVRCDAVCDGLVPS